MKHLSSRLQLQTKWFQGLVKSDQRAKKYLTEVCWKGRQLFCIRCQGQEIYRIRRSRYRCRRCLYEFSDFTGRWMGRLRVEIQQWLWMVRLFESERSARIVSTQLKISYPTVLKAFNVIRRAIAVHSPNGGILLQNGTGPNQISFNRKRKKSQNQNSTGHVFAIQERKGRVRIKVLRNVNETFILNLGIKMKKRGGIIYTDKFGGYDAFIFYGIQKLPVNRGKVFIDSFEGFWSYAKQRFSKFHGISEKHFPFYLKEMEFKYNHRDKPLFKLLIRFLCDFVPKSKND